VTDSALNSFARDFPAGTVLFREGDVADFMYVVQAGEVEIQRRINDSDRVLAVLPAGEFFGEMAILSGRPRSATAVVRVPSRLLCIEPRTFEAMLRGKTEIAVRMIKTLAGRLERANQQIEILLLQDANHRVVRVLRDLADEHLLTHGVAEGAIYLPMPVDEIARRVALPSTEVEEVLGRLALGQLVVRAEDVGIEGPGFVVPEVGRLVEFLEFLELKERYSNV
jgi:CRP/FNR family cyclic AMP-dependent transcriptional regulator